MVTEIPIITALVYTILAAYKASVTSEKFIKIIPLIAAFLGALFGGITWFTVSELSASINFIQAVYHGMAAGLAATGVNQVVKQLSAKDTQSN